MKIAYVVLGMHRSGTSSVAGALVQLGAAAPLTLMSPKPENPKGFWESEAIMVFNDHLLALCGSSWRDWRDLDATPLSDPFVGPDLRQQGLEVLNAEFGQQDRIVLKDPRMCRLFPFWADVLTMGGYRPLVITPLRAPWEVAGSLAARNEMSMQCGWRLWLQHVLAAERDTRDYPRHFMAWDAFLSDWQGQINLMSERLGGSLEITPEMEGLMSDFLVPDLKHHRETGEVLVSDMVARAHATMGDLAVTGEDGGISARLDGLRRAFQEAAELFGDVT